MQIFSDNWMQIWDWLQVRINVLATPLPPHAQKKYKKMYNAKTNPENVLGGKPKIKIRKEIEDKKYPLKQGWGAG